MNRGRFLTLAIAGLLTLPAVRAQEDPGKEAMGQVTVTVYYGTDGDPSAAGARSTEVSKEIAARLSREEKLRFAKYRRIGGDVKPLYRSYENWAQPLPPSDEILIRFEAQSQLSNRQMRLDLELWLSRKKILKTDAPLAPDKPLLVLGPEWRGGRLILVIEFAPGAQK